MRKLLLYIKLMRLDAPTGYLLSFFAAAYGLMLATPNVRPDLYLLFIFFIGSILARSAGCIINDILDRDFDRQVARTNGRMLAVGQVSIKEAVTILLILLLASLLILLSLTKTAIYIGFAAFFMICLYPLMKRFTNFAQVFLGLTFNLGSLIGYSAVTDRVSIAAIILYISTIFWTIGYDTIYGFMDIEDDKKLQLKSMAIFLENRNYKVWISLFYSLHIILFFASCNLAGIEDIFAIYYFIYVLVAVFLLYWQVKSLNINYPINCLERFKLNNFVGILLILFLLHY